MASKTLMFLLGTLLLLATKVSSDQEEDDKIVSSIGLASAPAAPVKPPTEAPAPKVPAPPVKPPTEAPAPKVPAPAPNVPAPAPLKVPTAAPPAKPPTPPIKPPTPAPSLAPGHPITKKDCIPLCEQRCKSHRRKRVCVRTCSSCCDKCKCVPPGTDGNREVCGKCYTDTITHGNQCP